MFDFGFAVFLCGFCRCLGVDLFGVLFGCLDGWVFLVGVGLCCGGGCCVWLLVNFCDCDCFSLRAGVSCLWDWVCSWGAVFVFLLVVGCSLDAFVAVGCLFLLGVASVACVDYWFWFCVLEGVGALCVVYLGLGCAVVWVFDCVFFFLLAFVSCLLLLSFGCVFFFFCVLGVFWLVVVLLLVASGWCRWLGVSRFWFFGVVGVCWFFLVFVSVV